MVNIQNRLLYTCKIQYIQFDMPFHYLKNNNKSVSFIEHSTTIIQLSDKRIQFFFYTDCTHILYRIKVSS